MEISERKRIDFNKKTFYERFIFPLVKHTDPEWAHNTTLTLLRLLEKMPVKHLFSHACEVYDRRLQVTIGGLIFPNPILLAAGFDKNALAARPMERLGFGGVENGSVTDQKREGNKGQRLWRLVDEKGAANYFGLNCPGPEVVYKTVEKTTLNRARHLISIAPIAKEGKPLEDFLGQIERLTRQFALVCDGLVINAVCPNVEHGIDVGSPEVIYRSVSLASRILGYIEAETGYAPPLWWKMSGDRREVIVLQECGHALRNGRVAAVIGFNALPRDQWPEDLSKKYPRVKGALSGPLVRKRVLESINYVRETAGDRVDIVACGGISNARDVLEAFQAGAKGVSILTALPFRGPTVASVMNRDLINILDMTGIRSLDRLRQEVQEGRIKIADLEKEHHGVVKSPGYAY